VSEAYGSSDRREVIRDAAAALFASKGVAATTVREIAEAVGILSGSLYHHFKSKQAIVEEILTDYFEDLHKNYAAVLGHDGTPSEQLRGLVRSSLETVNRHPYAAEIYQGDYGYLQTLPHFDYLKGVANEVQRAWLDVIKAGVATGDFRGDVDPHVFYRLMRDAVWLSVRWYRPRSGYPVTKLADDAATIFLQGFST
jgi:AcrR family transcriptional regulator